MIIGFVDWGIGGLSVYKEFKRRFPKAQCIYVSDASETPYGKQTSVQLIKRLQMITDFLNSKMVNHIVVACNAASTVLDQIERNNPDTKYYGMLDAGVALIRRSKVKRCLIIGGQRTIESNYFQNSFLKSKIKIETRVAQPLSAMVEKGELNSPKLRKELKTLFSGLNMKPDSLLLACTHYPALANHFKIDLKRAKILDPATEVIKALTLAVPPRKLTKGTDIFFTTGSVLNMKKSARLAFKIVLPKVTKIEVGP